FSRAVHAAHQGSAVASASAAIRLIGKDVYMRGRRRATPNRERFQTAMESPGGSWFIRVAMRLPVACAVLALLGSSGCEQNAGLGRSDAPRPAASKKPPALPSAAPKLPRADAGVPNLPLDPAVRRAMKLAPEHVHVPGLAI